MLIQSGPYFVFDVDIIVPCDYESDEIDLKLYFCNEGGSLICYYFPITLEACNYDCEPEERGYIPNYGFKADQIDAPVFMYPNPSKDIVNISIKNSKSKQHTVTITDHLGKTILISHFTDLIEVDLSQFAAGLHIVKVIDKNNNILNTEKLIILR